MALIAVPMAIICVVTLLIGGGVAYHYTNKAISNNTEAIKTSRTAIAAARGLARSVDNNRRHNDNLGAWRDYDECKANEQQDLAHVAELNFFLGLARQAPPSVIRTRAIDRFTEIKNTLEPPPGSNPPDRVCKIPAHPRDWKPGES